MRLIIGEIEAYSGTPFFLAVSTRNRACYFSSIVDGELISFPICSAVREIWLQLPEVFPEIRLDVFVIMPNHFHALFFLDSERDSLKLSEAVIHFKSHTEQHIRNVYFEGFKWEAGFFIHELRNKYELKSVREYIINNPLKWPSDRENRLSRNFGLSPDRYFQKIIS